MSQCIGNPSNSGSARRGTAARADGRDRAAGAFHRRADRAAPAHRRTRAQRAANRAGAPSADRRCCTDCERPPLPDLCAIPSIGPSKASLILAAVELGRRIAVTEAEEAPTVSSPSAAAGLLQYEMSGLEQEHLRTILLGRAQPADPGPRGLPRIADHVADPHRRGVPRGDQSQRGRDDRRAQPSQRRPLSQPGGPGRHPESDRSRAAARYPGSGSHRHRAQPVCLDARAGDGVWGEIKTHRQGAKIAKFFVFKKYFFASFASLRLEMEWITSLRSILNSEEAGLH